MIVGDQSAGKSSLLQSLTDIPFPVASRLCTQFPTLIVSRRTPYKPEVTRISILPAEENYFGIPPSEGRVERYAEFAREKTGITAADFVAVINEVRRPLAHRFGLQLPKSVIGNGLDGYREDRNTERNPAEYRFDQPRPVTLLERCPQNRNIGSESLSL